MNTEEADRAIADVFEGLESSYRKWPTADLKQAAARLGLTHWDHLTYPQAVKVVAFSDMPDSVMYATRHAIIAILKTVREARATAPEKDAIDEGIRELEKILGNYS